MAFWGVEVHPLKPVVHSCKNERGRGRLRITQATTGRDGLAYSVECKVGDKSPVLICSFCSPLQSLHLELEFEEAEDVVFSVTGTQSVFLTGYYVQQNR